MRGEAVGLGQHPQGVPRLAAAEPDGAEVQGRIDLMAPGGVVGRLQGGEGGGRVAAAEVGQAQPKRRLRAWRPPLDCIPHKIFRLLHSSPPLVRDQAPRDQRFQTRALLSTTINVG